ncbi:MAG: phosphate acyltransferase [Thermodesulfobacteriota bacterium]
MKLETQTSIRQSIDNIRRVLDQSGYFGTGFFTRGSSADEALKSPVCRLEQVLAAAASGQEELGKISRFLSDQVIREVLNIEKRLKEPEDIEELLHILSRLLDITGEFKNEPRFALFYGELLSVYLLMLFRSGSDGRESPIIRMILQNVTRRKAVEISKESQAQARTRIDESVTVAIITKRYALFFLITRGLRVVQRGELDFRTHGTSPTELALELTKVLLKAGIRLSEVSDIVAAGGDVGAVPDGIYVLTEKLRDESLKRLNHVSLNRGALVAWELRELLMTQGDRRLLNASLCSPLSFTTLTVQDTGQFFLSSHPHLKDAVQGYVKVTPLKSLAALMSEMFRMGPDDLNIVVMALDELFASSVRKIGHRIIREMAAQQANRELANIDFGGIVAALEGEGFVIPPHFRLATREMGTGVKEICELLMIVGSGKISPQLGRRLTEVVDSYANGVATCLEMSSTGKRPDRPHFIAITSMMAMDPYFQWLFVKIRKRIGNPFTPVLLCDSLEHEYLVANNLFEMYLNPTETDRRLDHSVEVAKMRSAMQVLGHSGEKRDLFSFSTLLEGVGHAISTGCMPAGSLVVVGADNEEALTAVAEARDFGLIKRVVLIGDANNITSALIRTGIPLDPHVDPDVELIATDPLAMDYEAKKQSMAQAFRAFLHDNPGVLVMKGSIDTAGLLRQALAIYKSRPEDHGRKRMASHTALFVLPDGRFFAISDAAINPTFRSAQDLTVVIENQLDVVRKVVSPKTPLKVAIITAVEKETAAIPSTHLAAETEEAAAGLADRYGPLVVEGPLSFDLATVPEVAEEKQYEGRIKGDANCLVATDINTANVLYKMLSKTMGSLGLVVDNGGIITAGPSSIPIILTSRGDTSRTKFNSILLALAYSAGVCWGASD